VYRFLIYLCILFSTGCQTLSNYLPADKLAIHAGFSCSAITGNDMTSIPAAVRYEVNTNRLIRLNPRYGKLNFGIEIFGNTILRPEVGELVGITPVLRYCTPTRSNFRLYIEAGAGPSYLSINTHEQEKKGFTFYDQVGIGVEFSPTVGMSFIFGYRFSHISHGGILRTKNRGIEGDTIIFGLSFDLGP
jgi:opacity protein-like surface antigen